MRVMMRAQLDVERSNEAIRDGSLPMIVKSLMEDFKPESAYFFPQDGKRTIQMVLDLEGSWQIPVVAERFFFGMNAAVDMWPVMNAAELERGLGEIASKLK